MKLSKQNHHPLSIQTETELTERLKKRKQANKQNDTSASAKQAGAKRPRLF